MEAEMALPTNESSRQTESHDQVQEDPEISLVEKPDTSNEPRGPKVDANTPISYLYMTFATELPSLPRPSEAQSHGPLPPCPDLSAYVSPVTWSPARKNMLLFLSCVATFLTAYSAGSYSPPSELMAHDLHTSRLAVLAGITTFCAGFGLAPMALAPISEIWGRYPVLVVAGILYVVFEAVCSVVPNLAGMLVSRIFVGVGGSVFSSIIGGVIADLWDKEDRNTAMALFSGSVLAGTGAGPLIASLFVAKLEDGTRAWQWAFWHQVILGVALMVPLVVWFKETRGPVLLSRRARKVNRWYEELEAAGVYGFLVRHPVEETSNPTGYVSAVSSSSTTLPTDATAQDNSVEQPQRRDPEKGASTSPTDPNRQRPQLRRIRWVVKEDEQRASLGKMISTSVVRPFYLLFTEPVVFSFSLWAAFSWGVLYLSFAVVPYLYADDLELASRVYGAMIAAAGTATIVSVFQERLLRHPQWRRGRHGGGDGEDEAGPYNDSKFWALMRRRFPAEAPESRLYFACITAMLLPLGLYGAFLRPRDTYPTSNPVGFGFATWGIYSVYLATFNYLADTYGAYASSALAAQSCCRNLVGGAFPLVTAKLFSGLGLKGAGGLLGGIATLLTIVPWVLVFWGESIRARSKFAVALRK